MNENAVRIFNFASLIVAGVMLADLIAHAPQTALLIGNGSGSNKSGITGIWATVVNSLQPGNLASQGAEIEEP